MDTYFIDLIKNNGSHLVSPRKQNYTLELPLPKLERMSVKRKKKLERVEIRT